MKNMMRVNCRFGCGKRVTMTDDMVNDITYSKCDCRGQHIQNAEEELLQLEQQVESKRQLIAHLKIMGTED